MVKLMQLSTPVLMKQKKLKLTTVSHNSINQRLQQRQESIVVQVLQLPKCELMRTKDSKLFSLASWFSIQNYQNVIFSHVLQFQEKELRESSPINVTQIQPTTRLEQLIVVRVGFVCSIILLCSIGSLSSFLCFAPGCLFTSEDCRKG